MSQLLGLEIGFRFHYHPPHFLLLNNQVSGAWMAQSVKHPNLDFGSDHDLGIVRRNPVLSSTLSSGVGGWGLGLLSLSLPLLTPPK